MIFIGGIRVLISELCCSAFDSHQEFVSYKELHKHFINKFFLMKKISSQLISTPGMYIVESFPVFMEGIGCQLLE